MDFVSTSFARTSQVASLINGLAPMVDDVMEDDDGGGAGGGGGGGGGGVGDALLARAGPNARTGGGGAHVWINVSVCVRVRVRGRVCVRARVVVDLALFNHCGSWCVFTSRAYWSFCRRCTRRTERWWKTWCVGTHMNIFMHIYRTDTHAHTHTYTHIPKHTHTHTLSLVPPPLFSLSRISTHPQGAACGGITRQIETFKT